MKKEIRKKAERILASRRTLPALIQSIELDLPTAAVTQNYNVSESQRQLASAPQSFQERHCIALEKLEALKTKQKKLDILYEAVRDTQRQIWEMKYVEARTDLEVRTELCIARRFFEKERNELLEHVIEIFYLGREK